MRGGPNVHDLRLIVGKSFPESLRGILGQDFLSEFDMLIDYPSALPHVIG